AGMTGWGELRGEYEELRELARCLRTFVDQSQLSTRRLEDLMPYSSSTISEKLSGRRRPELPFVQRLIAACANDDKEAEARMYAIAKPKWDAADPLKAHLTAATSAQPGDASQTAF